MVVLIKQQINLFSMDLATIENNELAAIYSGKTPGILEVNNVS